MVISVASDRYLHYFDYCDDIMVGWRPEANFERDFGNFQKIPKNDVGCGTLYPPGPRQSTHWHHWASHNT